MEMALTKASTRPGVVSAPAATGFLQLFMEANRLAGRTVSSESWTYPPRAGDGSVPTSGADTAADRRPE